MVSPYCPRVFKSLMVVIGSAVGACLLVRVFRQPPAFRHAGPIGGLLWLAMNDVRLAGMPHADQIGSDAASERRKVGNHVAPQIASRGIAVKKDNRITGASLDVVHV